MDNQQSQSFKPKKDYATDKSNSGSPQAGEQSISDKPSSVASGGTGGTGDSQSYLDKGISYLQQSITGKSGQINETSAPEDTSHHAAVDAAHPEKISEFLRDQNRSMTEDEGK